MFNAWVFVFVTSFLVVGSTARRCFQKSLVPTPWKPLLPGPLRSFCEGGVSLASWPKLQHVFGFHLQQPQPQTAHVRLEASPPRKLPLMTLDEQHAHFLKGIEVARYSQTEQQQRVVCPISRVTLQDVKRTISSSTKNQQKLFYE
jgi:hypothetical protein